MNIRIARLVFFACAITALIVPTRTNAQSGKGKHHHYKPIEIRTFGGPNGSFILPSPTARVLSNNGTAVGGADTSTPDPLCLYFNSDCYVSNGFKWQDGFTTKLDALPGVNNNAFAFWVSDSGLIAGESENGIDPLTGGPALEAIVWGKDGFINELGTFGGNHSFSSAVNSRGEVDGVALNTIPDPYGSVFFMPGATQSRAFRWTQSQGLQDLGTLGGPDSGAFLINENGQISGWSFTNSTVNSTTGFPTLDPFFWENGKMLDMGTLGGVLGRSFALNNRGQVAGFSDLAGDQSCHPFLWDQSGGMKDLGTLGGDSGLAYFVNDAGEVVGSANVTGAFGCDNGAQNHAFLWRNGVMTDLGAPDGDTCSGAVAINSKGQIVGGGDDCNGGLLHAFLSEDGGPAVSLDTLIPSNLGLQLMYGVYINDAGEIASVGAISNGDIRAFVLIPCDENHPGIEGCDYSLVDAATAAEVQPAPAIEPSASSHTMPFPLGMTTRVRSPFPGHGTPKPATHFSVSAPATAAIGSAFSFTVTALNSSNRVAAGYSGTVHFTSTDGQAVLPANSTMPNGVGNFSATLNTAGPQTITASDTATPSITGASSAITVSASSSLAITSGAPPNGTVGSDYSGSRQVCRATECLFIGGFPFTASGGVRNYTWSWAAATGSSLPPGLVLATIGFIGGQATTAGAYNVIVTVTDSASPAAHVSANYTINIAANPSQVTVTISASTRRPPVPLEPVTLIWSSTNATSCVASASPNASDWSGPEPTSGSAVVSPPPVGTAIIYTLTCTGATGNTSASVTVSTPCVVGPCRG